MKTHTDSEDTMLTTAEVARAIGVSTKTLHRWRQRGRGPMSVELPSGHLRWPAAYLSVWLASRVAA